MKGIRRGVTMALFDGWSIAVFAILTFIGGIFGAVGFLLGALMGVIAFVELYHANRLRSLDLRAARALMINQIFFACLLIAYAGWNLSFPAAMSAEIQASARDLKSIGIDFESMNRAINQLVYGGLIVVAIFGQGSLALFYWRRQKMVREYLSQTPQWIVQMQRAGVGV